MNQLSHLVEPARLLMTWQPTDESASSRTRRIVGEVIWDEIRNTAIFRYLKNTEDFSAAEASGFKGFPAFRLDVEKTDEGVLLSLMRRLPPRNREDFADYLHLHGLAAPFTLSDMALLGYTGARLPSDGFALVPEFPSEINACEYVMEVAGTRHALQHANTLTQLQPGDSVSIEPDPKNPIETDALSVICHGQRIGYVNRALKPMFHRWLRTGELTVKIVRLNGKPTRPLVYVCVHFKKRSETSFPGCL